jgi:hypothetical protein
MSEFQATGLHLFIITGAVKAYKPALSFQDSFQQALSLQD